MFRILCLTNGQYIKISAKLMHEFDSKMPSSVREAIPYSLMLLYQKYWTSPNSWEYLVFDTEDAAKWFVSHRLVYNPRRKDTKKLQQMEALFLLNDIPGWQTNKLEFLVESV